MKAYQSRKQFIESRGATCDNWTWSWSFINKPKRFIIFGAWNPFTQGERAMIFSEEWKINAKGKKNSGYAQSREHIRLIEEEGYGLMTFPMLPSEDSWKDGVAAKIESFGQELTEKTLVRVGIEWFATDAALATPLAEELPAPERYPEGARHAITINAYERNPKARAACIAHHGYLCAACDFDFAAVYGDLGKEFIHVHHIKPIGTIGREYKIDPKADLIPVCPNCHAMIHRVDPALTVEKLRTQLRQRTGS